MSGPNAEHDTHTGMFQQFVHSEVAGSAVLLLCAVIALAWANSPWADAYHALEHQPIGLSWGDHRFSLSLGHWIGDGLMVIFFFVVGLEIKREVVVGQLSSLRLAILPVSAALGGMVVPAVLYFGLNRTGPEAAGWGIPMATDIAFALGILALFGNRVPMGLKVFLAALAIADDLGAVLVIAIFYTDQISLLALGTAAFFLLAIFLAGRAGVRQAWIYLLLMVGVWVAILASGVHATVAGVLIAMLIPVRAKRDPAEFLQRSSARLAELRRSGLTQESMIHDPAQLEALDELYVTVDEMRPAGLSLEHALHPIQAFLILPLFALFKAGVPLGADTLVSFPSMLTLGVIVGLVVGKPMGVMLASWLAIRGGWAELPEGVTWPHLWGVGCLAGIGFTMSIFISELAFSDAQFVGDAKIGVLAGSVVAGVLGYLLLRKACR